MKYLNINFMQLMEKSPEDLMISTQQAFPTTRRDVKANQGVDIKEVRLTGNKFQKYWLARFDIKGNTGDYQSSVKVEGITFDKEKTPTCVEIQETSGDILYVEPVPANANNVKLRCNCKDFIWRFSRQNAKVKALNGPVPKLQSKGLRPSVNPTWAPGMCKHLHKAVDHLKKIGLLK